MLADMLDGKMHWVAIVVGLCLVVLGAWLVKRGVWPRKQRGKSHCQGCGYNLTGSVSKACPECGCDLTDTRPRPGGIWRCIVLAVVGLVVLLAGVLPFVAGVREAYDRVDWLSHAPEWWLLMRMDAVREDGSPSMEWVQLYRRYGAGDLSQESLDAWASYAADIVASPEEDAIEGDALDKFFGGRILVEDLSREVRERMVEIAFARKYDVHDYESHVLSWFRDRAFEKGMLNADRVSELKELSFELIAEADAADPSQSGLLPYQRWMLRSDGLGTLVILHTADALSSAQEEQLAGLLVSDFERPYPGLDWQRKNSRERWAQWLFDHWMLLSKAQQDRVIAGVVAVELQARKRVRVGEPVVMALSCIGSGDEKTHLQVASVTMIDGQPITFDGWAAPVQINGAKRHGYERQSIQLAEGTHRIEVRVDAAVHRQRLGKDDDERLIGRVQKTVEQVVEVLPADAPDPVNAVAPVDGFRDQSWYAQFSVGSMASYWESDARRLSVYLPGQEWAMDVPLAFDVVAMQDGKAYPMSSLVIRPDYQGEDLKITGTLPDDGKVDLIFTPNADLIRQTPDLERFWNGPPIVVTDMPTEKLLFGW